MTTTTVSQPVAPSRKTTADVKCYLCGQISGALVQEEVDGKVRRRFQPKIEATAFKAEPGKTLRCLRCGGPVFLEDMRTVAPERPPFEFRQRRPRRKKQDAQAA